MEERQPARQPAPQPEPSRPPRSWMAPTFVVMLILVPVLILIFSNTGSEEIAFGPLSWRAPLWVILAVTFVAGAVATRLLFWFWRAYSRRRRARRETAGGSGA